MLLGAYVAELCFLSNKNDIFFTWIFRLVIVQLYWVTEMMIVRYALVCISTAYAGKLSER